MKEEDPEALSERRGPGKHIWISQPLKEFIEDWGLPGETWSGSLERILCISQVCAACSEDIPDLLGTRHGAYWLCEDCRDRFEATGSLERKERM